MESIVILDKAKERESLYNSELKKQVRSVETYYDQIGNFLFGLARFSGWWVACTTVYTAAVILLWFMFEDFAAYSYPDFKEGLRVIIIACGGASALACIFSNIGRFRNIFHLNAQDYVDRHQNFQNKVRTIESVLLKYELIDEQDIETRKKVESKQARAL